MIFFYIFKDKTLIVIAKSQQLLTIVYTIYQIGQNNFSKQNKIGSITVYINGIKFFVRWFLIIFSYPDLDIRLYRKSSSNKIMEIIWPTKLVLLLMVI